MRRKPPPPGRAARNGRPPVKEQAAEVGADVVGWVDERTGASGFLRGFMFRKVPEGDELVLHARLRDDVRLPVAGGHGRVPGDVLRAGPEPRLRQRSAHHQRRLPRLAGARHAPLGRDGDDRPDLPAHGADVLLRRLQVPARAELGDRRRAAGADAGHGPDGLPAAVRPALLLGHGGGGEHHRHGAGGGTVPGRLPESRPRVRGNHAIAVLCDPHAVDTRADRRPDRRAPLPGHQARHDRAAMDARRRCRSRWRRKRSEARERATRKSSTSASTRS